MTPDDDLAGVAFNILKTKTIKENEPFKVFLNFSLSSSPSFLIFLEGTEPNFILGSVKILIHLTYMTYIT